MQRCQMKKYKYLSYTFIALAILLSNVMCATVAYHYCDMLWAGQYMMASAPASVAFVFVIPYAVGITICVILALVFRKRFYKSL